jgi:FkbM family methyltransferase
MNVHAVLKIVRKLGRTAVSRRRLTALLHHGVLAGTEHAPLFALRPTTIVDIGANRGQFALAARTALPNARIISFEPLARPAAVYRALFAKDVNTVLHEVAIGVKRERGRMHVSARDDSSSLLPFSPLLQIHYPGTHAVDSAEVLVAPLTEFVTRDALMHPSLLKIDVQGSEFEALRGCEELLTGFDLVYCECSFVELYAGQRLAADVIDWLAARFFALRGLYNIDFDKHGNALQADFLFRRRG